jgi:hypothetical protein
MKKDLVNKWRKLIFETETKLKEFEDRSDDSSYEDKCVYESWEHFLWNQKSSLENYINFLNNNHNIEEDK